jgi:hypothetical protein
MGFTPIWDRFPTEDVFTVNCRNCEDECSATQIEEDLWRCNSCGYLTDSESSRIVNETQREYYKNLYIGAKIAGMIDEPDVPRERKTRKEYRERKARKEYLDDLDAIGREIMPNMEKI